jgi:hypothetical protein
MGGGLSYFSTTENLLRLLLEFIWTRLNELYGFHYNIWGDDLEVEAGRGLLSFRAVHLDGRIGWEATVSDVDGEKLNGMPASRQRSPEFIRLEEFVLLERLRKERVVRFDDPGLLAWLDSRGVDFDSVCSRLLETRLVALSERGLELIAKQCDLALLPTGEYVAAENSTGRLNRWVTRRIEESRE